MKKFIIFDASFDENGIPNGDKRTPLDLDYPFPKCSDGWSHIIDDGIIGRITEDNAYLTIYAEYPDTIRPKDLKLNHSIRKVKFSLCGSTGYYDIYRVK